MEKTINEEAEVKLTPAEKAESKFLQSTFKDQLTQEELKKLRERFPSDVVLDMTDEATFKEARKTRTERNKLVEAISRRRIDFTNNLKLYSDTLEAEVTEIFDVVVKPFEIQDQKNKDEAARIKREHEEMLDEQRHQLDLIKSFIDTAKETDDTNEISSLIDTVSNTSAEDFHKDIIHEVMQTLKSVSKELTEILMQKIESNSLRAEAEAAEKARIKALEEAAEAKRIADEDAAEAKRLSDEAAAEAKRISDEAAAAQEKARVIGVRLSTLQMIPLDMMGEPSHVIAKKLYALSKFNVPQDEFEERYEEALQAKADVISRLEKMLDQANILEKYASDQQAIADHQAAEKQAAHELEMQNNAHAAHDETHHVQDEAVYQEPVQQEKKAADPQEVLASMKRASDLVEPEPISALLSDLRGWGVHYQVQEQAFNDLLATLSNHNVNY